MKFQTLHCRGLSPDTTATTGKGKGILASGRVLTHTTSALVSTTWPTTTFTLNPCQKNEYILTTLRTEHGCSLAILKSNFAYDVLTLHGGYLRELENHNLISLVDQHLKLTEAGRLLADKIASDLFLIE